MLSPLLKVANGTVRVPAGDLGWSWIPSPLLFVSLNLYPFILSFRFLCSAGCVHLDVTSSRFISFRSLFPLGCPPTASSLPILQHVAPCEFQCHFCAWILKKSLAAILPSLPNTACKVSTSEFAPLRTQKKFNSLSCLGRIMAVIFFFHLLGCGTGLLAFIQHFWVAPTHVSIPGSSSNTGRAALLYCCTSESTGTPSCWTLSSPSGCRERVSKEKSEWKRWYYCPGVK